MKVGFVLIIAPHSGRVVLPIIIFLFYGRWKAEIRMRCSWDDSDRGTKRRRPYNFKDNKKEIFSCRFLLVAEVVGSEGFR